MIFPSAVISQSHSTVIQLLGFTSQEYCNKIGCHVFFWKCNHCLPNYMEIIIYFISKLSVHVMIQKYHNDTVSIGAYISSSMTSKIQYGLPKLCRSLFSTIIVLLKDITYPHGLEKGFFNTLTFIIQLVYRYVTFNGYSATWWRNISM